MATTATKKMIESFVNGSVRGRPVPLKSTAYEIDVLSGVAVVRQRRVFRNDESVPIEAVMTFPVAFEGVVTRIEAEIAGRRLRGAASAKAKARETYEAAVDVGKAAVLHEELMRGIHMVSVANVAPGAEIAVEATFVMPVSIVGGQAQLRVPQTVGDIYGRFSLQDSDQLTAGGLGGEAVVKVSTSSGVVHVNGRQPVDGIARVGLDDQIFVRVEGLALAPVRGRAADGRAVTLSFLPHETRDVALDFELMVDVSGSMRELVCMTRDDEGRWDALKRGLKTAVGGRARETESKWDALKRGVRLAAAAMGRHDAARLWTFGDECVLRGRHAGTALPAALDALDGPRGGTYLVEAVNKVVAERPEANVLIVTDGKSATGTELDVERIVATGARITVVLIGGDALEARVGHLAAQSGGQMFVAHGGDASSAVRAAIAAMRAVALPARRLSLPLQRADRTAGGLSLVAEWRDEAGDATWSDHVGAFAASLALTGLDGETAAALAASEGLVSHLTSIVLVDEEGAALEQLPEQRKVSIPAYGRGVMRSMGVAMAAAGSVDRINVRDIKASNGEGEMHVLHRDFVVRAKSFFAKPDGSLAVAGSAPVGPVPAGFSARRRHGVDEGASRPLADSAANVPFRLSGPSPVRVDWVKTEIAAPIFPDEILSDGATSGGYDWWIGGSRKLLEGFAWGEHLGALTADAPDFEGVPLAVAAVFVRVSAVSWVVEAARSAGRDPRSMSVGLLAALFADESRAAARISRRLLAGVPVEVVEVLKAKLAAGI